MSEKSSKKLILASASPRRKEILKKLGLNFEIIPSNIDENIDSKIKPVDAVKILAHKKAEDITKKINYSSIIIGCDTTVVVDDISLGKPKDNNDAFKMLKLLSNRSHKVISGIAIIDKDTNKTLIDYVSSDVYFKELSNEEINNYIKTKEPNDKAGAYAIQGFASVFITGINGCYNNIVGLPVFKLSQMLKEFDIDILSINTKF